MISKRRVKIVCISDTHNLLCDVNNSNNSPCDICNIPEGKIVIHSGDATGRGSISDMRKFVESYKQLLRNHPERRRSKHVVFVPGNHDFCFETPRLQEEAEALFSDEPNFHLLINDSIELEGLKIWGSPVTPPFANWAFNWCDSKREELWATIPNDTDIIVTHGPPRGILDTVYHGDTPEYTGCFHLAQRVAEIKPILHVFGHIHEEGSRTYSVGDTTYINASIMDENYDPTNSAMVHIIEQRQTEGNILERCNYCNKPTETIDIPGGDCKICGFSKPTPDKL